MSDATNKQFATIAGRLEADLKRRNDDAAAAPASGLFSSLTALIAALRAGDVAAVGRAVRDLLNVLLGDDGSAIQFQREAVEAAGVNWVTLISRLLQLQRLLFGA